MMRFSLGLSFFFFTYSILQTEKTYDCIDGYMSNGYLGIRELMTESFLGFVHLVLINPFSFFAANNLVLQSVPSLRRMIANLLIVIEFKLCHRTNRSTALYDPRRYHPEAPPKTSAYK
jgi:hypothetical protein